MEALFNQFWDFTTVTFGPLGPFYAIAALGAILVIVAAPLALRKQVDPIKRLENLERRGNIDEDIRSLRVDEDRGKFKALSPYLEPADEGEMSEVRARLINAGYRSRSAVRAGNRSGFWVRCG